MHTIITVQSFYQRLSKVDFADDDSIRYSIWQEDESNYNTISAREFRITDHHLRHQ
jgi:hypothetical protein